MGTRRGEELREALREKDANEALRKLAVRLVLDKGMPKEAVAGLLDRSVDWVDTWVERYREGGIPALLDLPRPGRPASVPHHVIYTFVWGEYTGHVSPVSLRDAIEEGTGVRYHIASVRRFLRTFGFSRKRPTLVHVNRAGPGEVRKWQADTIPKLRRLAARGYTLFVQDESLFVNDVGKGAKHWSPVGKRIYAPYTGSHDKFAAFGALADDGRQFFRTYDRFDTASFLKYLREMHRKFGRVAVVVDKAPQHRATVVRDYLEGCAGEVLLFELPTGSPQMNAMEEVWRRGKHEVRDSVHYPSVGAMRAAVSKYLRVTRHHLDIFAYLGRKVAEICA